MLGEVGRQRSSCVGGIRIHHLLSVTASTGRRGNIKTLEHSFDYLLGADVSKQYRMPVDENLPTALFLHRPQREHSYSPAPLHPTPCHALRTLSLDFSPWVYIACTERASSS